MTPIQARVAYALGRHHGHGWTYGVRAVAIRQLADEGDQGAIATIREMVATREVGYEDESLLVPWTAGDAGDVPSLGCLLDPTGDEGQLARALVGYMALSLGDRELADRIGGCSYAGGWVGLPEPDAEGEVEHTTGSGRTTWAIYGDGDVSVVTSADGSSVQLDWSPGGGAYVSREGTPEADRWERAEGIARALDEAFPPSVYAVRRARGE